MVPSPGFSIPSIGTPVHQPEEDQQIIQTPPLQPQDVAMSICSLQIQQQPMNKIYETNNMGYASPHNTIRFHIPVIYLFIFNISIYVKNKPNKFV